MLIYSRCKTYISIPSKCKLQKVDACCSEPVCPDNVTMTMTTANTTTVIENLKVVNNDTGKIDVKSPSNITTGEQVSSVKESKIVGVVTEGLQVIEGRAPVVSKVTRMLAFMSYVQLVAKQPCSSVLFSYIYSDSLIYIIKDLPV